MFITSSSSDYKVRFQFERDAADFIEPTYTGNTITANQWVYIGASQAEDKTTSHVYKQRLVIADGRSNPAVEVGTKSTETVLKYSKYANSMYLGGYRDSDPKSFSGYVKEIKLFSAFHDSP